MRVKIGRERQLKPQAKHTLKVHVWGGISKRGATNICIFDQTMDAPLYIGILRDLLLPFIEQKFLLYHVTITIIYIIFCILYSIILCMNTENNTGY